MIEWGFMKIFLLALTIVVSAAGTGFFLFSGPRVITLGAPEDSFNNQRAAIPSELPSPPEFFLPERSAGHTVSSSAASAPAVPPRVTRISGDLPLQPRLTNPPSVVRGIYLTSWTAGSPAKVQSLLAAIKKSDVNAVVIDIKDYSGYLAYRTGVTELAASGAERDIRISRPNALIKEFHDHGIYVIGRVSVFQDSVLPKHKPELALSRLTSTAESGSASGGTGLGPAGVVTQADLWKDQKGLLWLDPASRDAWDYTVAVAKDAWDRGFDEINFDYIRFPSDGNLAEIRYPVWDGTMQKHEVIREFFSYVRARLPDAVISADLFGLATIEQGDLGIGQVIEDAYSYFDYVSPMVYPSHYASGFLGYKNPAQYPYEVIQYSLEQAMARLRTMTMTNDHNTTASSSSVIGHRAPAKLRPWLQAFDLGATYNTALIYKQIKAVEDVLGNATSTRAENRDQFVGWLLWDPKNIYAPLFGG